MTCVAHVGCVCGPSLRSQIATIGVAAASNVVGVIVGGIFGHSICTGAAVLGGKHLATHIDERMVAVLGGVLFLVFGVSWFDVSLFDVMLSL
jgi:putative Ca2+/H+ antiporter (TMEM165/GDT1 family)